MAVKKTLLSAVAIAATAQAQQTAWGQCWSLQLSRNNFQSLTIHRRR